MGLDVTKKVEVPYNTNWIVPNDGVIFLSLANSCGSVEYWGAWAYLDNSMILNLSMGQDGEQNGNASIPVTKGQIFSISAVSERATYGGHYAHGLKNYFIPYKK